MAKDHLPLWRKIQRENFTCLDALLEFLQVTEDKRQDLLAETKFIVNVPLRIAAKMAKNDLSDPLFLQFVPLALEAVEIPGFIKDPVGDTTFCKTSKLLQKYQSRALLVTTGACVMHCRFCFRQNFPYETQIKGFVEEMRVLKEDTSIEEVILSGGDPLSLSNQMLGELFAQFEQMKHIQRIRFHTRFPIGIPERIDAEFLSLLENSSKQVFFVLHCNHPNELDEEIIQSLKRIHKTGAVVLNQSVLLKGVNDKEEVLLCLYRRLVSFGVIPYYLHKLDQVIGTNHFKVEEKKALDLMRFLQKNVSGYAVPRLVQEIPGRPSKTFVY